MESVSGSQKIEAGFFSHTWRWLKAVPKNLIEKVVEMAKNAKKLGQDDPRIVIHSLKAGLALSLVSLFYYFQPLYSSFGVSAMSAVVTVVLVFEFSVGATIGKGLNRGVATLLAGALGIAAHHLAQISGRVGEPILLGLFVFLQAATSTFIRFFPKIKARYDYGLLIFILTFCLVSVSGFRDDEILELAQKRLSTVAIGACICVIVSIFICPVWAGEELHNEVAQNMEKLGNFLEGFGDKYFKIPDDEESGGDKSILLQGYGSVLNSKNSEETWANFARWEPGHGQFMYRHPWKQYLKVGSLTRQCAYQIEALNGHLNSEIQVAAEIRGKIQETCTKMSLECGKALKELALAIKTMKQPYSAETHVSNSKIAAKNLKSLLKSGLWEDTDLLEVMPVATVVSTLIDVVICVETIAESVLKLASLAHFKRIEPIVTQEKRQSDQLRSEKQLTKMDCPDVVIAVHGLTPDVVIPVQESTPDVVIPVQESTPDVFITVHEFTPTSMKTPLPPVIGRSIEV